MATYAHPNAKASWQGNYDVKGAGYNGIRIESIQLEVTAAQLTLNDVFKLIKLSNDTAVIGGWIKTDTLDSHTTPTLTLDIGYDLDSGTDDPNFFFDPTAAASFAANFIAGIGTAAAPFVASDDYTVTATVSAAPATAAAGTIYVYLILADASSVNAAAV